MKLNFIYGGVDYSVESIMEFTKNGASPYWSEPFFRFYPEIDRAAYAALDDSGRRKLLADHFAGYESENRRMIYDKLQKYNSHWQLWEPQIISALEDAFLIDLSGLFNDMTCMTTYCPISPRYLNRHSFDNFIMESEKGALGTAIHEIIHFVWFHVWRSHFRDDPADYETPHLKWIFSEMAVEPIMRDPRLGGINPYYAHNACVYSYFYTMTIDGRPILDILHDMHASMPITGFMETGWRFCREHESEIRRHISDSENP